jgi:hypothetical protein
MKFEPMRYEIFWVQTYRLLINKEISRENTDVGSASRSKIDPGARTVTPSTHSPTTFERYADGSYPRIC